MTKHFRTIFILIAALLPLNLFAQIRVQAPSVVALDEQFNLVFTVEGDRPSNFQWECPSDFTLVWGPQQSSSSSVSIVNGKRTSSRQTSYTYILMPTKEGIFSLPAATATAGKRTLTSPGQSIRVVAGGAAQSSSEPSRGNAYEISGEDLFLRLNLNRTDVVLGESIHADIKLYKKPDIAVTGFDGGKFPSFDGFWSQTEDPATEGIEFKREAVGNQIYDVAAIRSYTLVPQQSGDLTIDQANLVSLIRVRNTNASSGSIFDSFFQDDYTTVRKRVSTKTQTVHVRPLPQPQPQSFCGGVGKFRLSGVLSKDSLSTHEAASLVLTLSGTGNLALVQAPSPKFPSDFEVYDVKSSDKNGARIFEYPFIPRHHGDYVIPPVEMSYYDPSIKDYVTLRTEPLKIKVSRVAGDENTSAGEPSATLVRPQGEDVRNIGSDIRYISTKTPKFRKTGVFFMGSGLFFIILAALLLLSCLIYVVLRRKAAMDADVQGKRSRGASKMARKRLALAGDYLQKDLYSSFYEELHRALLGFVSDRLALDPSMQDKPTISKALIEAGVSQEDAAAFVSLLDECEYARYAPNVSHEGMDGHYRKALEMISAMDSDMHKHRHNPSKAVSLIALFVGGSLALAPNVEAKDSAIDSLWVQGVSAYSATDWQGAVAAWSAIAESGEESSWLYTNLADACFKDSDIAHAILWWKRALKLDPSNPDARYNLQYAGNFLQDKIESVPEFFLNRWVRTLRNSLESDTWGWLFIIFLAFALAGVLLLFLSSHSALRRTGFIGGLVSMVFALCCLGFSIHSKTDYFAQDEAVVVSPVCVVRSSPDSSSGADLFVLHEGTTVSRLDELGSWTRIELSDGREGWLQSDEIELI